MLPPPLSRSLRLAAQGNGKDSARNPNPQNHIFNEAYAFYMNRKIFTALKILCKTGQNFH